MSISKSMLVALFALATVLAGAAPSQAGCPKGDPTCCQQHNNC